MVAFCSEKPAIQAIVDSGAVERLRSRRYGVLCIGVAPDVINLQYLMVKLLTDKRQNQKRWFLSEAGLSTFLVPGC